MPRIGATLAALILIACSIAVNVSRYPVVWEMTNPVSQLPPAGQTAQSEPAAHPDEPSSPGSLEVESAPGPSDPYALAEGNDTASSPPVQKTPRCSDGICSLGQGPSGEAPDPTWREDTYEDPYPSVGPGASPDKPESPLPVEPKPRPQQDPAEHEGTAQLEEPALRATKNSPYEAEMPSYGDDTLSYGDDASSYGEDDSVTTYDAPRDDSEKHGDSAGDDVQYGYPSGGTEQNEYPSNGGERYDYPSDGDEGYDYATGGTGSYEPPLGGVEPVEPSGPYAGSGPGDSPRPDDSSRGEGRRPWAAWPETQATRPVVPVVPQDPGFSQGSGSPQGPGVPRGDDADVAPPYGPGPSSPGVSSAGLSYETRRLPPVDELNPFLNDGYDPPVPDISGMDYPSTGMPPSSW